MSDKISEKAVELSDEELDDVSGGRAFILEGSGVNKNLHQCTKKNISGEKFYENFYNANICGCCDRKASGLEKKCINCKNYVPHNNLTPAAIGQIINPLIRAYDIEFHY